jgi:hypothetical protein
MRDEDGSVAKMDGVQQQTGITYPLPPLYLRRQIRPPQ